MTKDIRWKQRFDNLERAYKRLNEALNAVDKDPKDTLYPIALVGAFQFTFELSWKTLKDYLKYSGVDASLPRDVIKQAFHHQLIRDGQVWINMLDDRNMMAHVYQEAQAIAVTKNIRENYFKAIREVHDFFKAKLEAS